MKLKRLIRCSLLAVGLLAIAAMGVFLRWADSGDMISAPSQEQIQQRARKPIQLPRPATAARRPISLLETNSLPARGSFDFSRFLDSQKNAVVFTKTQIEKFIEAQERSPDSLLTAYQAALDPAYLQQAAARYPNNAAVQLAVVTHRACPSEHRKWVDAYLRSAPKNAIAYYLSALDHFEQDHVDAAITDLMEATRQSRFRHDSYDRISDLLELLKSTGQDTVDARLSLIADMPLPHLQHMKQLSDELAGLMVQYRQSGDTNSFASAAFIGGRLAARLNEGMDSAWIAAQRVRIDIERHFFRLRDQDDPFAFNRATVRERLEYLDLQNKAIDELEQRMNTRLVTASEQEREDFLTVLLNQGQITAIRWIRP